MFLLQWHFILLMWQEWKFQKTGSIFQDYLHYRYMYILEGMMYLQIIQDYLYQNFGPKINIVFKQKSGNTKMNENAIDLLNGLEFFSQFTPKGLALLILAWMCYMVYCFCVTEQTLLMLTTTWNHYWSGKFSQIFYLFRSSLYYATVLTGYLVQRKRTTKNC